MTADGITTGQRNRLAVVYIRQSSPQQIARNPESQRRQRGFVNRAVQLGWPANRIHVIDEDMGQSGARSGSRQGFQQMVAMAALGRIGIILALEVSRLARSNGDWYQLLDVCAVAGILIADEEGLYDPAAYNRARCSSRRHARARQAPGAPQRRTGAASGALQRGPPAAVEGTHHRSCRSQAYRALLDRGGGGQHISRQLDAHGKGSLEGRRGHSDRAAQRPPGRTSLGLASGVGGAH